MEKNNINLTMDQNDTPYAQQISNQNYSKRVTRLNKKPPKQCILLQASKKIQKEDRHYHNDNICFNCQILRNQNDKLQKQLKFIKKKFAQLKKFETNKINVTNDKSNLKMKEIQLKKVLKRKAKLTFTNQQEQQEFENGLMGYYFSPFCENDHNNCFDFSRNLQHNFRSILSKLQSGFYKNYFSKNQTDIENKLYKILNEILKHFTEFKNKFNTQCDKVFENETPLSVMSKFNNSLSSKRKGRSKRQLILIKDADKLDAVIEDIAKELDVKIQIQINLNTNMASNYFLETEKNILLYPISFKFVSYKKKECTMNCQVIPISMVHQNLEFYTQINFLEQQNSILMQRKQHNIDNELIDIIADHMDLKIPGSYLDNYQFIFINKNKKKKNDKQSKTKQQENDQKIEVETDKLESNQEIQLPTTLDSQFLNQNVQQSGISNSCSSSNCGHNSMSEDDFMNTDIFLNF